MLFQDTRQLGHLGGRKGARLDLLEAIYKNDGVFKCLKVFQWDNDSEVKRNVTKLSEKHNVDI